MRDSLQSYVVCPLFWTVEDVLQEHDGRAAMLFVERRQRGRHGVLSGENAAEYAPFRGVGHHRDVPATSHAGTHNHLVQHVQA